jgi:hypothetical protein
MGVLGGVVFLWLLLGTAKPVDAAAQRRPQTPARQEATR